MFANFYSIVKSLVSTSYKDIVSVKNMSSFEKLMLSKAILTGGIFAGVEGTYVETMTHPFMTRLRRGDKGNVETSSYTFQGVPHYEVENDNFKGCVHVVDACQEFELGKGVLTKACNIPVTKVLDFLVSPVVDFNDINDMLNWQNASMIKKPTISLLSIEYNLVGEVINCNLTGIYRNCSICMEFHLSVKFPKAKFGNVTRSVLGDYLLASQVRTLYYDSGSINPSHLMLQLGMGSKALLLPIIKPGKAVRVDDQFLSSYYKTFSQSRSFNAVYPQQFGSLVHGLTILLDLLFVEYLIPYQFHKCGNIVADLIVDRIQVHNKHTYLCDKGNIEKALKEYVTLLLSTMSD